MKKISLFSAIFFMAGLLLWAFPFFSVALSAPTQVVLELAQSDDPDPVIAGNMLTYTLSVTNSGQEIATGVVLTDTLPEGASFDAASPVCIHVAGEVNCDLGSLDLGASTWVTITVGVDPSARGSLTNIASASSIESGPTAPIEEVTTINASATLGIAKSDGVSQVMAGDELTYTYAITVTNAGPSDASNVHVVDAWPDAFTREVVDVSPPGTCDTQTSDTDFTCDWGDIPAGGQQAITVTYSVPPDAPAGMQTNTVQASSVDAEALVTASDVNTVVTSTTLGISKNDGVGQVTAGDGIVRSYTIQVTNAGPSDASDVVVTDTWPAGFDRVTVSHSTGGTCDTTNPANFTCTFASIPADGHATITANYTVPPGTPAGTQTNTVEVDSVAASDVNNVTTEADLSLTKLDDPDPVHSGEILTYNLTVTNNGPSDASEVVLVDDLPTDTLYNDSLSSPECTSIVAGIVSCPLGTVTAGSNRQVVIKVQVTKSTSGQVTNQASVTAFTFDPNAANNQASAVTAVDVGTPVVNWVEPVTNDLEYVFVGCLSDCPIVHLEASATDDAGVERVEFYRWDHVNEEYVEIGSDYTYPYMWEFDTSVLPIGYNQTFTRAYDYVGHLSERKRIILSKWIIFLPMMNR